jgi:serpin B
MHLLVQAMMVPLLLALLGCIGVNRLDAAGNKPGNSNAANTNESTMENNQPTASGALDTRLAAANTRFGFKLYSELVRQSAEKNIFISPSSISLCLAMAYNGADAETRQAMARVLETQAMSLDELNRTYRELKMVLENADAKVQLQIANSLWAREGLMFKPDFIQRTKDYFNAQVTALNFDDPAAPATLNWWVSEKTHGKIDKIVDQIDAQAILFLINAIYFKGVWAKEFDKAKTKPDNFTLLHGTKQVPMMSQSGNYQYLETKDFQAVSLPYGGGRFSFYVFLPSSSLSFGAFEKSLTEANWQQWMEQFRAMDGDISLPRFRVEYEAMLNDALKALGMGMAFDEGRANFSGMIQTQGQNVYISRVKHKTFVEVNEEGTEAAAVTSTEMHMTALAVPHQRFNMVVDRPFFCAIRDNTTGAVLFIGSIYDPQ